jgi:hypothetical protein
MLILLWLNALVYQVDDSGFQRIAKGIRSPDLYRFFRRREPQDRERYAQLQSYLSIFS